MSESENSTYPSSSPVPHAQQSTGPPAAVVAAAQASLAVGLGPNTTSSGSTVSYIPAAALKRFADALESDNNSTRFLQVNRDRVTSFVNRQPQPAAYKNETATTAVPSGTTSLVNSRPATSIEKVAPNTLNSYPHKHRKVNIPGIFDYSCALNANVDGSTTSSLAYDTSTFLHLQELPEFNNALGPRSRFGEGDGSFFDRWLNADTLSSKQAIDKHGLPVMNFSVNEVHSGFKKHLKSFRSSHQQQNPSPSSKYYSDLSMTAQSFPSGSASNSTTKHILPYAERRRLRHEQEQYAKEQAEIEAKRNATIQIDEQVDDAPHSMVKFAPILACDEKEDDGFISVSTVDDKKAAVSPVTEKLLRSLSPSQQETYFGEEGRTQFFEYYHYLSRRRQNEPVTISLHNNATGLEESKISQSQSQKSPRENESSNDSASKLSLKNQLFPPEDKVVSPINKMPLTGRSQVSRREHQNEDGVDDDDDNLTLSSFLDSPRVRFPQIANNQLLENDDEKSISTAFSSHIENYGPRGMSDDMSFNEKKLKFGAAAAAEPSLLETSKGKPTFAKKKNIAPLLDLHVTTKKGAKSRNPGTMAPMNPIIATDPLSPIGSAPGSPPSPSSSSSSKLQKMSMMTALNRQLSSSFDSQQQQSPGKGVDVVGVRASSPLPDDDDEYSRMRHINRLNDHYEDDSNGVLDELLQYSNNKQQQIHQHDDEDSQSVVSNLSAVSLQGQTHPPRPTSARTRFLKGCVRYHHVPNPSLIVRKTMTTSLSLSHMSMGDDTALVLAESLVLLPAVEDVLLADNVLTEKSLISLLRHIPYCAHVKLLDISGNNLGRHMGRLALLDYIAAFSPDQTTAGQHNSSTLLAPSCHLETISLSRLQLDDIFLSQLVDAMAFGTLHRQQHRLGNRKDVKSAVSKPNINIGNNNTTHNAANKDFNQWRSQLQQWLTLPPDVLSLCSNKSGTGSSDGGGGKAKRSASPTMNAGSSLKSLMLEEEDLHPLISLDLSNNNLGSHELSNFGSTTGASAAFSGSPLKKRQYIIREKNYLMGVTPAGGSSASLDSSNCTSVAVGDVMSDGWVAFSTFVSSAATAAGGKDKSSLCANVETNNNFESFGSNNNLSTIITSTQRLAGESLYFLLTHPACGGKRLTELSLSWNMVMVHRSGGLLAEAFRRNTSLMKLDISHTGLGKDEKVAEKFAFALYEHPQIQELILAQNELGPRVIFILMSALKVRIQQLEDMNTAQPKTQKKRRKMRLLLDVSENPIGMQGAREILWFQMSASAKAKHSSSDVKILMQNCSNNLPKLSISLGNNVSKKDNEDKEGETNDAKSAPNNASSLNVIDQDPHSHWFEERRQRGRYSGEYILDLSSPYDYSVCLELLRIVAMYSPSEDAEGSGAATTTSTASKGGKGKATPRSNNSTNNNNTSGASKHLQGLIFSRFRYDDTPGGTGNGTEIPLKLFRHQSSSVSSPKMTLTAVGAHKGNVGHSAPDGSVGPVRGSFSSPLRASFSAATAMSTASGLSSPAVLKRIASRSALSTILSDAFNSHPTTIPTSMAEVTAAVNNSQNANASPMQDVHQQQRKKMEDALRKRFRELASTILEQYATVASLGAAAHTLSHDGSALGNGGNSVMSEFGILMNGGSGVAGGSAALTTSLWAGEKGGGLSRQDLHRLLAALGFSQDQLQSHHNSGVGFSAGGKSVMGHLPFQPQKISIPEDSDTEVVATPSLEDIVDDIFARYDSDGSGLIEEDELITFLLDLYYEAQSHQHPSSAIKASGGMTLGSALASAVVGGVGVKYFVLASALPPVNNSGTVTQPMPPAYRPPEKGRLLITVEGHRPIPLWKGNAATISTTANKAVAGSLQKTATTAVTTAAAGPTAIATATAAAMTASNANALVPASIVSGHHFQQETHGTTSAPLTVSHLNALLEATKGLSQRETLLEEALTSSVWTVSAVKNVFPILVKEIGSVLRTFLLLLPHMANAQETRALIAMITQHDFAQVQHLRDLLGPLFKIYIGIPDGFYRLELSNPIDREAFLRLFQLYREQYAIRKHAWKRGDTSQLGNHIPHFRNVRFQNESFQISEQWMFQEGLPMRGLLEFDFVSLSAPLAVVHGTVGNGSEAYLSESRIYSSGVAISNYRLFRILSALELIPDARRMRVFQKLSMSEEDGRLGARGTGHKRVETLPFAAKESADYLDKLYGGDGIGSAAKFQLTSKNSTDSGADQALSTDAALKLLSDATKDMVKIVHPNEDTQKNADYYDGDPDTKSRVVVFSENQLGEEDEVNRVIPAAPSSEQLEKPAALVEPEKKKEWLNLTLEQFQQKMDQNNLSAMQQSHLLQQQYLQQKQFLIGPQHRTLRPFSLDGWNLMELRQQAIDKANQQNRDNADESTTPKYTATAGNNTAVAASGVSVPSTAGNDSKPATSASSPRKTISAVSARRVTTSAGGAAAANTAPTLTTSSTNAASIEDGNDSDDDNRKEDKKSKRPSMVPGSSTGTNLRNMMLFQRMNSALFRMPSTLGPIPGNGSMNSPRNRLNNNGAANNSSSNTGTNIMESMYGRHLLQHGIRIQDSAYYHFDRDVIGALYLDTFEILFAGRFFTCAQIGLICEKFPCGEHKLSAYSTYRVELIVSLFSRIIDKINFEYVLRELTNAEVAMLYYRLGYLHIWNPLKAEGNVSLNLARYEERLVFKILLALKSMETGETFLEVSYRNTPAEDPIPQWTIPVTWFSEIDLPMQGIISLQYFSGKGMELQGCKPHVECRMRAMALVLADPYEEDIVPYSVHLSATNFEQWIKESSGVNLCYTSESMATTIAENIATAEKAVNKAEGKKSPRR